MSVILETRNSQRETTLELPKRVELLTCRLQGGCSCPLSYDSKNGFGFRVLGFEIPVRFLETQNPKLETKLGVCDGTRTHCLQFGRLVREPVALRRRERRQEMMKRFFKNVVSSAFATTLAERVGFEPTHGQINSLMPYQLGYLSITFGSCERN